MTTRATVTSIAAKYDWDQIAAGPIEDGLFLIEFERIKPHDEKVMMLLRGDDIVALTVKVGSDIGTAPETAPPAVMFYMLISAMVTI